MNDLTTPTDGNPPAPIIPAQSPMTCSPDRSVWRTYGGDRRDAQNLYEYQEAIAGGASSWVLRAIHSGATTHDDEGRTA
jgi:hypothetical protein